MTSDSIPDRPIFASEVQQECERTGDFSPLLFEWYKYVGLLCHLVACFERESPAWRDAPPLYYTVLVGLMHRCSRLMLSNIALSANGKFGETTTLIDRCILETAIKVQWLCYKNDPESFVRYLADGLKNDLILKSEIENNIRQRNGKPVAIEQRMLNSIDRCVEASGLSQSAITEAKKLPDLFKMYTDLGMPDGAYTVIQRMGSHAVHGTWTDLLHNYLNRTIDGSFTLRDHNVPTHQVQYV